MSTALRSQRTTRWPAITAFAGTFVLAVLAFWLSFTALSDLSRQAGIPPGDAWMWPISIDGLIIVATIAVVVYAPHGRRATVYPWVVLALGSIASIVANVFHALRNPENVLGVGGAIMAAAPPVVLLIVTHLAVRLANPVPGRSDRAYNPREGLSESPNTEVQIVDRAEAVPVDPRPLTLHNSPEPAPERSHAVSRAACATASPHDDDRKPAPASPRPSSEETQGDAEDVDLAEAAPTPVRHNESNEDTGQSSTDSRLFKDATTDTEFTREQQQAFELLAAGKSQSAVASIIGKDRKTVGRWVQKVRGHYSDDLADSA